MQIAYTEVNIKRNQLFVLFNNQNSKVSLGLYFWVFWNLACEYILQKQIAYNFFILHLFLCKYHN